MDLIDRQTAIDAVCKSECGIGFCGISCPEVYALKVLPSVEAISVKWIDNKIARLKEMDNASASLMASQLHALLNDWRVEKNEG